MYTQHKQFRLAAAFKILYERVTKELTKAKQLKQHATRAGPIGAYKRWRDNNDPNCDPNGVAMAKISKDKISKEKERK